MVTNLVYSGLFLIAAILLFLTYNRGTGGAFGSIKKRITFLLAFISFCAFMFFLTKAYYYTENKRNERITQELLVEYNELEKMINLNINKPNMMIQEKQLSVKSRIQQLADRTHKEYETYFNILINILSAFLGWIIVFTFRNRILG